MLWRTPACVVGAVVLKFNVFFRLFKSLRISHLDRRINRARVNCPNFGQKLKMWLREEGMV